MVNKMANKEESADFRGSLATCSGGRWESSATVGTAEPARADLPRRGRALTLEVVRFDRSRRR